MEYAGVPSFPKRVILASTQYRGPGLESRESTAKKPITFSTSFMGLAREL